jgi:hypothetical protein
MVSPVDYYAAIELASPEVLYVVVIVLWRGVVRQSEVKVGHLASIPERLGSFTLSGELAAFLICF